MKGYRFYLEFGSKSLKRKGQHEGTVIAVIPENSWLEGKTYMVGAIAALLYKPNSPVCGCNSSWDYIHDRCKRISEKRAREIHPALFEYLDYNP